MDPRDLDKLITKYLEGRCTDEESEFINAWYASLGQDRAVGERNPEANGHQLAAAEERILSNVRARVSRDSERHAGDQSRIVRYAGIAASLLICCAAVYFFLPSTPERAASADPSLPAAGYSEIKNTSDVPRRVILTDGSLIELSPKSSVRFSDDAEVMSRELHLDGEAYFDVAHDSSRPFYVYAGNMVTRVLGTTFIVRALGEDETVTVSVKTGKVTVYSKNSEHKKTVLVPNQEAVYHRKTDAVATQVAAATAIAERSDPTTEMHFEETPVPEVLARLKQVYEIEIVFGEEVLSGCVLTSSFYEEGLYDRIDVICTAIGATYQVVDSQIHIKSNGCNLKTE